MTGWQHGTHDFAPDMDGDEEAWARALAAQGWHTCHRTGLWVVVGSTRVRLWAMRRPCGGPFSVHDHENGVLRGDGVAPVRGDVSAGWATV